MTSSGQPALSGGKAPASGGKAPASERERARLTRDVVVGLALELADKSGLESLTIRKLATELGVTPMALYWHFRSKEELLAGLADRVWSEIDIEVDPAVPWPDQVRGIFESLLTVLRTHPAAAGLLMRVEDKLHSEASLRATEVTLQVLHQAGFDPDDASAIARSALWTGFMLVMSEPGIELRDSPERDEILRKKQVELATLPPAKYPRLVECAFPMTSCDDPEAHYQLGVDLFIAGVTALAATRTAPGSA